MDSVTATNFGFSPKKEQPYLGIARNPNNYPGEGDGNGLIEGNCGTSNTDNGGNCIGQYEPVTFWSDLTYANGMRINLVEGYFNVDIYCSWSCGNEFLTTAQPDASGISIASFYPAAKIGGGNWVYAYSSNSTNYFGISQISSISYCCVTGSTGLTVRQAYDIDKKIDDGLPQTGTVFAQYVNNSSQYGSTNPNNGLWAAGNGGTGAAPGASASSNSTSCYDNGGSASALMQYSLSQNRGNGVNCALSFKFQ